MIFVATVGGVGLVGVPRLMAQTKSFDQGSIAMFVLFVEIRQEPSAAADQFEQTTPRVVVMNMRLEVLYKLVDAFGEQRNLYFW